MPRRDSERNPGRSGQGTERDSTTTEEKLHGELARELIFSSLLVLGLVDPSNEVSEIVFPDFFPRSLPAQMGVRLPGEDESF